MNIDPQSEEIERLKRLIDQESGRKSDNKEYSAQGTYAFICLAIGLATMAVNPLPAGIFIGAGLLFLYRWKSMKEQYFSSWERMEKFEEAISAEISESDT